MAEPEDRPAAPTDSVLLQQFAGLKNTVNAERLSPAQLERALNIDIDNAGQPRRRRGYTQVASGNFHSIWLASNGVYGVKNGAFGKINPDYSFVSIQSGIGPAPLAYVQVGDNLYFSSMTNSGVVNVTTDTYSPWGAPAADRTWLSPVVNPTATLSPIRGKLLGPPPMATGLAYLNGRIYLASENVIWATELYLYNYVDKTKNFLTFESNVTAIGNGTDGIYVGTERDVWYLTGPLNQMKRTLIMNSGVLPGSMVSVPAELVSPSGEQGKGQSKNANLFMTTSGLCVGLDDGVCYNLTQDNVLFPVATSVAPMFRRQDGINQYVGVTDSGGTPGSNTRIGDYVDAEIRRFQGA